MSRLKPGVCLERRCSELDVEMESKTRDSRGSRGASRHSNSDWWTIESTMGTSGSSQMRRREGEVETERRPVGDVRELQEQEKHKPRLSEKPFNGLEKQRLVEVERSFKSQEYS